MTPLQPPKAPPVDKSPRQLALAALIRNGADPAVATAALLRTEETADLVPVIEAERQRQQAEAQATSDERWYLTTDGKKYLAIQGREARAARQADVDVAKDFAINHGLDPDEMNEDELLDLLSDESQSDRILANDRDANIAAIQAMQGEGSGQS